MIDQEYIVIDDFLPSPFYDDVISGVQTIYDFFVKGDKQGNEFNMLASKESYDNNRINTLPTFMHTYLSYVLHENTNLFFQNILYLKDAPNGLHWHIDSQINDRIKYSGCMKYAPALQNCTPVVDLICTYYPVVPPGLEGGQFCMKIDNTEVSVDIVPNRLIKLQGHIEHRVLPMNADGIRISMITEQMSLDSSWLNIVKRKDFEYSGTFEETMVNCSHDGFEC